MQKTYEPALIVIVATRYRRGVTIRGLQPETQLFTRRGAENNRNNHYQAMTRPMDCPGTVRSHVWLYIHSDVIQLSQGLADQLYYRPNPQRLSRDV